MIPFTNQSPEGLFDFAVFQRVIAEDRQTPSRREQIPATIKEVLQSRHLPVDFDSQSLKGAGGGVNMVIRFSGNRIQNDLCQPGGRLQWLDLLGSDDRRCDPSRMAIFSILMDDSRQLSLVDPGDVLCSFSILE